MNDPRPRNPLDLIVRHLEGDLSPAEFAALNALLRDDLDARKTYRDLLDRGVALRTVLRSESDAPLSLLSTPDQSPPIRGRAKVRVPSSAFRVPRFAYPLAAALLLAAAAVAIYVGVFNLKPETRNPKPAASAPVATVVDTSGHATLLVNDDIAAPGSEIRAGGVVLDKGTADFRLANGVAVTLRGPTHLTVHDPMHATLTRGSATFDCPPAAKGYTVHLPDGSRIVDLGTAFRVSVNDAGHTKLRVTEGKVKWVGAGDTESAIFTTNQTAWIAGGRLLPRPFDDVVAGQSPLAYWRFNESSGTVAQATRGEPAAMHPSITPGVPGPRLAGFEPSNTGCRLADSPVELPLGRAMNATAGSVSFWVSRSPGKAAKLYYGSDSRYGDGGGSTNELHLDMQQDGTIHLFIRAGRNAEDVFFGTTGAYDDDAWHHVAATWDTKRTVIHVDGGALAGGETVTGPGSTGRFAFTAVHRFGAPANVDADRNFAGRLDELAIWTAALTAEHVADQYHAAVAITPDRRGAARPTSTDQPTPASETADR